MRFANYILENVPRKMSGMKNTDVSIGSSTEHAPQVSMYLLDKDMLETISPRWSSVRFEVCTPEEGSK